MNSKIFPVILCGGVGKRLWPVSRQSYPKQFSKILGPISLFQNTVERYLDSRFEPPLILTNNDYRFIIEDQLKELCVNDSGIIIEPSSRDTAPAILAAAMILKNKGLDNSLMLILPSDHTFGNQDELKSLIFHGSTFSEAGEIVTFGINPDRIETGYGWIEASSETHQNSRFRRVISFHEKPTKEKAEYFYKHGNFLWNSGIYLVSTETIINSFKKYLPELMNSVFSSVQNSKKDLKFTRLDKNPWDRVKPISVDYAIIERSANLLVAQYDFGWDDLGNWEAVWRENEKDGNGVVSVGKVFSANCNDSYLRSENPRQQLVALGCEDMIVVTMPDAVLVSKKDQVQGIKMALNHLHEEGQQQSWQYPVENRYWGKVESLFSEEHVQINRLVIQPAKNIVLQRHSLRAEHWVVLKGTAQIILENKKFILRENQSLNVPIGVKHSISNTTDSPLILIEVQTGTSLDKNDIERLNPPIENYE